MNGFCSFNDTFDSISFSESGKIKRIDVTETEISATNEKSVNTAIQSVTFDDSIFLSDSFTFSAEQLPQDNPDKNSEDLFKSTQVETCRGSIEEVVEEKSVVNISCPIKANENRVRNDSQIKKRSKLSDWNLPESILHKYASRNITDMFDWQCECLANTEILENNKNLVYSAPTSAGKTLVSEILAIKTLLERNKKVIFILPFVSVVREKMFYFQDILSTSGIRVEGFMGSYNPPGGFQTVQMAICTIEKANSLINRLLEEDKLSDIGALIVDEMHLLADPSRGYLLELLLTKVNFMCRKREDILIQIIGMSATLPNLNTLADWLNAVLYTTNYRPIPLFEQCQVNREIYDNEMNFIRKLPILNELETDTDNILQLCLETIEKSCSVLMFCPTKNWCENLAQQIATAIWKLGRTSTTYGECLRNQLGPESISEVLEQLKRCPVGLDKVLYKTISFSVAFHHAGLTMDERDIVEGAFRSGAVRILIATSTLSSGVNLPARRVIIRTPLFHGKAIDALTYRQMIGRAGRMGKDTAGESFLICQKNDYAIAKELMSAELEPIESCLNGSGRLKRAILEVIASSVVSTPQDLILFTSCTLYANQDDESLENPIGESLRFLSDNQFIRLQNLSDSGEKYIATPLGKACLSSSMPPEEGLALFTELEKARQCFVLETELHLVYLVTPYSACNQWGNVDWMYFLELWEKLPPSMRRVGDLVGIRDVFLMKASRGKIQGNTKKNYQDLQIHKRFYVALALQDLVNEIPLGDVASKFNCTRGTLQSLQQSAATFAGMVTSFSKALGWSSVEILISQFQDRLHFGVNRDLLDLMRLPVLNGPRARALYNSGIENLVRLAAANIDSVEDALRKMAPFESDKERDGESKYEAEKRNKVRAIWVTGKKGLTEREAAEMLIMDARKYLEMEMGLVGAEWESNETAILDNSRIKSKNCINDSDNRNKSCDSDIFNESIDSIDLNNPVRGSLPEQKSLLNGDVKINSNDLSECIGDHSDDDLNNSNKDYDGILGICKLPDLNECIGNGRSNLTNDDNSFNVNNRIDSIDLINPIMGNLPEQKTLLNEDIKLNSHDLNECIGDHSDDDLNSSNKDYGGIAGIYKLPDLNESIGNGRSNLINDDNSFNVKDCIDSSSKYELKGTSREENKSIGLLTNVPEEIFSDKSIGDENQLEQINWSNNSLFENSFELTNKIQLPSLDSDTLLEKAFALDFTLPQACDSNQDKSNIESNTSSEYIGSSQDQPQMLDTPLNRIAATRLSISARKRSRSTEDTEATSLEGTPIKRCRKKDNLKSPTDLNSIEIIDVCKNLELFRCFSKELGERKEISISLGCVKVEIPQAKIGGGIVKKEDQSELIVDNNRWVKGMGISWGDNVAYYIDFESDIVQLNQQKILLKGIFDNPDLKLKMFQAKEQVKLIKSVLKVDINTTLEDPKVADWLLESEGKEKNLQAMALKYYPDAVKLTQLATGCKGVGSIGLDLNSPVTARIRTAIEAISTYHIVNSILNSIAEEDMQLLNTYYIEMESILILTGMELIGICTDRSELEKLSRSLNEYCVILQNEAYRLAGRNFSFASAKDIAKILGTYKRGKRVSTNKQVLERNENPIAPLIIQWRKINSTLTKMIYPLLRIIRNDRIHSDSITFTATGRISMHEPNLQNIPRDFNFINPIDSESTQINCRNVFITGHNLELVSADYCQLELRLLAHLSQDPSLCRVMRTEEDVFKSIGAKLNNIRENEVTDELRQRAKQICYGIIYGMSVKSLGEQLNSTEEEARNFLEEFHKKYTRITPYINRVINDCKQDGYVVTIAGRRRYLPNINDNHPAIRAQAERQAVNTIIQGSAADIAKNSMVLIEKHLRNKFKSSKNKPRLILQLHDEFLYETPQKYSEMLAKILKKRMENSVGLDVPFPVKIKRGKSWGSLRS